MKKLRILGWGVSLATLIFALNQRWAMVPPLGEFFSPQQGVWRRVIWQNPLRDKKLSGLRATVSVTQDKSNVLHVFAQNDEDIYFIQGYLLARDRLWQMDFQARTGLARLSEIFGPQTLPLDRFFVQLQMEESATRALEKVRLDNESWMALESFTNGVNARIAELKYVDWPIEYKMLGIAPEPWSEKKSLIISKLMAFQLSAFGQDVTRTRTALKLGQEEFSSLFPFVPAKIFATYAAREGQMSEVEPRYLPQFWPDKALLTKELALDTNMSEPNSKGSNAWAVSAKHSESGTAILANDPHLKYSLPSIWYPIHLQSDTMDVIGYSIVGTPGIVIGSTPKLSWGVTNGYFDVIDWYAIKFRSEDQQEYLVGGRWEKTWQTARLIHIRGFQPEEVKVKWSQWGPIVGLRNLPPFASQFASGLAFRWMGHRPSNEFKTFFRLNRAEVIEDCPEALQSFVAPSQNFVCADSLGRIGTWLGGVIPKKSMGQGRFVLDGTKDAHQWQGYLEPKMMPQNVEPASGFIFTANQHSVAGRYKFEVGDEFPSAYRAQTIEANLSQKSTWSIDDFQQLQNSLHDEFLCDFKRVALNLFPENANPMGEVRSLLAEWSCEMAPDSKAATFFHEWWKRFYEKLWQTRIGLRTQYAWPDKTRTLQILRGQRHGAERDPTFKVLVQELNAVLAEYRAKPQQFLWATFRRTELTHIAKIPGFDRSVVAGGSADTVLANQGGDGPSMRFIAQMDARPKIFMALPGGRSGEPGSAHYTDWVKDWETGQLRSIPFFESIVQARGQNLPVWEFGP